MKKIIIPLEFNHPQQEKRTVLYGARMALDLRMELVLTHSLSDSQSAFGWIATEGYPIYNPPRMREEQEEYVHNMLSSYERLIQEELDMIPPINIHILRNIYAERHAGKTKENGAEFVILCRDNILTKPVFMPREVNPESMGYKQLPVIIHPPGKDYAPVDKILFATNYHSYDMEVLKKLTGQFNPNKTEITALHITEDLELEKKLKQAGFLKLVRSETRNDNIRINTQLTMGKADISNLLRSFAVDMEADLLVVLREEKSFLEKLLRQDVIEKLARESELPLMIFFEPVKAEQEN